MGDWMNRQLTGIEDAFSGRVEVDPSDEIKSGFNSTENLFSGEVNQDLEGDWGEGTEGSLSGYTAEIDPDTGKTRYFKDITVDRKKALEGLSKIGNQTPKVIGKTGRLPGVNIPSARGGRYSPTQSPYEAPSYLQGSTDYNAQVARLVNTLLSSKIRGRSIKSLI
tara:strand:- start:3325 stop:3819 length:495 start_codon:yes stop_codon:yes gene_type:complete